MRARAHPTGRRDLNARLDAGGGHRAAAVTAAAPARRERAAFDYRGAAEVAGGGGVAGPRARRVPARADFHRGWAVRRGGVPDGDLGPRLAWHVASCHGRGAKVYREVHGVLGKFAKDVEEEGKRLARDEERQHLLFEEYSPQPQRKWRKK